MKSYAKSWILKASLILGFLAIDLVSKYLLQSYFDNGGEVVRVIPKVFNLEYVKNTGISFGMFKESVVASLILPILFLCVFGVYDAIGKEKKLLYSFGFSMIVAGALGNLYDRILLKFVRDFFAFSFFPFVFNCADACITIGFVLVVVNYVITLSKKEKSVASGKKIDSASNMDTQGNNEEELENKSELKLNEVEDGNKETAEKCKKKTTRSKKGKENEKD